MDVKITNPRIHYSQIRLLQRFHINSISYHTNVHTYTAHLYLSIFTYTYINKKYKCADMNMKETR